MESIKTKCCSKCGVEKSLDNFYKSKKGLLGRESDCKVCRKKQTTEYYSNNKDKKQEYQQKNSVRIKEYKKQYEKDNPPTEYNRNYIVNRYNTDDIFKLKLTMRRNINRYISQKKVSSESILGCSWEELKNYIENQFQDGMTWDNNTVHGWHIDHKYPLSKAKTEEEVYRLNHYTNLQPLWCYDNLNKSDKLPEEWISEN